MVLKHHRMIHVRRHDIAARFGVRLTAPVQQLIDRLGHRHARDLHPEQVDGRISDFGLRIAASLADLRPDRLRRVTGSKSAIVLPQFAIRISAFCILQSVLRGTTLTVSAANRNNNPCCDGTSVRSWNTAEHR